MHLHLILIGLLLGWGAAVPVGPINLEIIRRNLRFGAKYGIALGMGADLVDLTYLILLSAGALAILTHPLVLKVVGIIGSIVLVWFGISALRMKTNKSTSNNSIEKQTTYSPLRHFFEGYVMTMFNPYTILFWSALSAQIANLAHKGTHAPIYTAIGVILGTTSWVLVLNITLHFTKHRLSAKVIDRLNFGGGIILLAFAALGFWHALS